MRVNDTIMPRMDMTAANILSDTALDIARRKERYAMSMWSAFSDRALRTVRRSERNAVDTERRRIAIRMPRHDTTSSVPLQIS